MLESGFDDSSGLRLSKSEIGSMILKSLLAHIVIFYFSPYLIV